jgi:LPXTG-motif cell wall-anchored protein
MGEVNTGSSGPSVVTIVAIVLLVLIGFFLVRGFGHRGGGDQGAKSNIQINIPRPTAPGK